MNKWSISHKVTNHYLEMWLRTPWIGFYFICGDRWLSIVQYAFFSGWSFTVGTPYHRAWVWDNVREPEPVEYYRWLSVTRAIQYNSEYDDEVRTNVPYYWQQP